VLDRLAIHAAGLTCCAVYGTGWSVWGLLLSRDVLQTFLSIQFVKRTRTVVIGAHWHMLYGIAMLIWGSAFIFEGSPVLACSVIATLISIATFADYYRRCRFLERRFALSWPAQ
jgi:phosphatidylglycerophosphate synthase